VGLGDGSPPAGSKGRAPVRVWGLRPQKLTTYYENNSQKHCLLVGQSKNNEIEGFGGRPPVGGRPGARGPLNPALDSLLLAGACCADRLSRVRYSDCDLYAV